MRNEQTNDTMRGLLDSMLVRLRAVERRPIPAITTAVGVAAIASEDLTLAAPEGATYLAIDTGRVVRRNATGIEVLATSYDDYITQAGP